MYSELHLSWLELVDRLRRTGMSIAEMREYTALVKQGRSTLRQRQELLSAHRMRVKETIADWTAALPKPRRRCVAASKRKAPRHPKAR